MGDDTELASRLVSKRHLTIKHLQLALEWQREAGGSVIDLLLQMRAVTEDVVSKVKSELLAEDGNGSSIAAGTGKHSSVARPAPASKSFARGSLHGFVAPTMSDDRRSFRRTKLPADWSVSIGEHTRNDDLEILNLSMGGLAFKTSKKPPSMGALLEVKMASPKGHALSMTGQVCHVALVAGGRYSVGVEYVEPSAGTLMVLDSIVREYSGSSN